jgi:gas vesicle protein
MKTKPTDGMAVGRRDFLRGIGTGAVGGTAALIAAPLAATPAKADSETANERTKARYKADSPDIQAYYRVNRYPAKK